MNGDAKQEESSANVTAAETLEVLAGRRGWSPDRARGYVDGVTYRARGKTPSKYASVGIDEYCLGFRAGYYNR